MLAYLGASVFAAAILYSTGLVLLPYSRLAGYTTNAGRRGSAHMFTDHWPLTTGHSLIVIPKIVQILDATC